MLFKSITKVFHRTIYIAIVVQVTLGVGACQTEYAPANKSETDGFVTVRGGRFYLNDKPYFFMGTNLWYGAYLGMAGEAGDRDRLSRELDILRQHGITNLRILAASESTQLLMSLRPATQTAPGEYNEKLLEGLDFLLAEMAKRNMKAVLFLNNFWQWSGGMSQYVVWATGEKIIDPDVSGDWPGFIEQSASFYRLPEAQTQYRRYVESIITRKNTVSGVVYRDDPAIMSWQLANEPRPGIHGKQPDDYRPFVEWIEETAQYINELAPKQLVSSGSEGTWGSVDDKALFIESHDSEYIDYLTCHLWVKNWSWFDATKPEQTYSQALENAKRYIKEHIDIAASLNKPIVMEEFGVERDDADYRLSSSTIYRDKFYREYFQLIMDSASKGGPIMGVNFWSWGGLGRAQHEDLIWREGDPFVGDPPQEPQGLNSVFADDKSTLAILKEYAAVFESLKQRSDE